MTAKEIEAARKVIYDELRYHGVDNSSTIDALERLDALCGEVERLKAELSKRPTEAEAVVMRELCETYCHRSEVEGRYHEGEATGVDLHNAWERLQAGAEDYRAMKGGSDA